jgi:hypothetical protein
MGSLTSSPWQVITTHEIEAAHAAMTNWSNEETDNPLLADDRDYYKVEKWTKDGSKVDRMLYAGNNLEKAKDIFAKAVKHRPRIKLTIRQRTQVLEQWPKQA